MKKIITVFLFIYLFVGNAISAQIPSNISPQQLEQFKRLPPAQQKSLAQSMGVDYNAIRAQLSGSNNKKTEQKEEALPQLFPRGTKYDEFGNPIFDQEAELEKEEDDDGKPKPFGYDVFANEPFTFAPSMDIAIPENYLVGPGDTLKIQMFGKESNDFEIEVSREGDVVVPQLGAFNVTGMTFIEAKQYLANEIKNKVLGVNVIVTLSDLRSIRVFVLGDAYRPGQYVLNSLSSATHAIIAAGGISEVGSLRDIQIKRGGKLVANLDLYDLLIKGDSSHDIILKSGDVVFISSVGDRVTVDGEVKRPAIYELKEGEKFQDVIKMAGGMLPSAYPSSTIVEGFNDNNLRTVKTVDFNSSTALSEKAKDGDVVKVTKTSSQYENSVTFIGAVTRPGKYQWHEGQRIADLIPNIHAYVASDADLTYGLVIREKDIGRNIDILQFSLFNAVSDKNSEDNLVLQARDRVLIFSNQEVISTEIDSLESLAFTKDELLLLEKENAEKRHEDKLFWQYYENENSQNALNLTEEVNKAEETLKQTYKSIEELTGAEEEEPELRELNFFSRKRLLAPVIEQLKRQAASGEPLQLVEVDGAVKFPGVYPLAKNGRVDDLVKAAGGLQESAYLANAEMTRNDIENGLAVKQAFKIDLASALAGESSQNKQLQSKDRLNIHHIPAWQENHTVELKGEFMFPGKYTIRRGETLGQLIKRVGGFTDFAYLEGSLFTRETIKELELKNLVKVSESLRMEIASKNLSDRDGNSSFDYEQTSQLLADLTSVKPIGRLVIDIPLIVANEQTDVILEDGDMLYIPTKQNSVNVVGQVQVTSSHIYQTHLDAFDYIGLSGGMKKQADEDRVYVIKANGQVHIPSGDSWFASDTQELQPGDTVVVPLDSYYMEDLTLWQVATQIIYQAAVAVAAISNL
ncbi:SLBB domain-containing protein [Thalassotalea sp. PP2-459]|uniref:SLBB domain-containing protein n=1 Tax=Thalassotalea sp. PP2-459 TaxID=1742724 RepID=UPI0009436CDA|nr:SLBB domain-containing protein [Thalassotalea sp. PP2-459]OKY24664.1 polysaccharide biosynthesis/export protein [Thalassotalea sp. PP2-459]